MKALGYASALLLALLAATALRWATEHFTDAPSRPPVFDDPRLSHHQAAHLARAAVRAWRELPPYERRALAEALAASTTGLDRWAAQTAARAGLVCLGERHADATRRFVARKILPRLAPQTLMLETGAPELAAILERHRHGEPATLLGADLGPILDAAADLAGRPLLVGIDESAAERKRRAHAEDPGTSREDILVARVRKHWRDGAQHVVLFGALHCRDLPGWMFRRIARSDPRIAGAGMLGVTLLERDEQPGAQMLFYLLEEMGLDADVVVIPDISRFPRQIQAWLPPAAGALAGFDSAILFDAGVAVR